MISRSHCFLRTTRRCHHHLKNEYLHPRRSQPLNNPHHRLVQVVSLHSQEISMTSFSQVRTFSTDNNNQNQNQNDDSNNTKPISNRAAFKAIPIHQSALSYIRNIGVGLRPMQRKNKKVRKKSHDRNKNDNNNNDDDGDRYNGQVLSTFDEKDYFANRGGRRDYRSKNSGSRGDNSRGGNVKQQTYDRSSSKTNSNKSTSSTSSSTSSTSSSTYDRGTNKINKMWLPPPPFSSSGLTNEWIDQIKRLPVKIIGSVGSKKDKMPRSSKGLPEVAIIGRSNVGKSTLLNALLYGNQELESRKYVRGKTPVGSMLGKGIKAVVSNKPGETKHITFYQLTSQITEWNKKENDKWDKNDKSDLKSSKMSLVLADLPGYGFAYANEEKAEEWKELMTSFLLNRDKSLKRILLLIDARHGIKKADYEFLDLLQSLRMETNGNGTRITLPPIQLILTKSDLVTQNDLARRMVQVRQQLSDSLIREPSSLPVMLCSAKAGLGFNNVRNEVPRGGILEIQRELAALVPKRNHKK